MNLKYKIADNVINLAVDENLPAWQTIRSHYEPFAVADGEGVLDVRVCAGSIPAHMGVCVHESKPGESGILSSRVWQMPQGDLVMEFRHKNESHVRLSLRMSAALDHAVVVLADSEDANDRHLLSHALMVAFMLATCGNGTLLVHASAVIADGKAYLFQGKSGTGKSTHAALWTDYIEGAELLNDDNPVIRFDAEGRAIAYGSPWSGKTHCYRNVSAPVGAMVRIVRASDNWLKKLSLLQAYASLSTTAFSLSFMPEKLRAMRHHSIERLAATVPCCEMHCRPDPAAALTCKEGLQ